MNEPLSFLERARLSWQNLYNKIVKSSISILKFLKKYIIYFAPAIFLLILVFDSYQMDFRALYVAGKSVIYRLDPYLNHVTDYPELFDSANPNPWSRYLYPPFGALIFVPFGFLSYSLAKLVFSLLIGFFFNNSYVLCS